MQLEQIGSLLGILIIFGLVLYGSYYTARKVAGISLKGNQSKYIKLCDRMVLGQDRYLAIISIGKRFYLIGSSGSEIRLLTEIQEEDLTEPLKDVSFLGDVSAGNFDFKEILRKIRHDKDDKS